jgi:putative endonuclease
MEVFTVYILYSENNNRLYIGYSSNSLERYYWHNGLSKKGFTTRYRPWKMIHIEFYPSKSEAIKREKALKSGQGRIWIRNQIIPYMRNAGFLSA